MFPRRVLFQTYEGLGLLNIDTGTQEELKLPEDSKDIYLIKTEKSTVKNKNIQVVFYNLSQKKRSIYQINFDEFNFGKISFIQTIDIPKVKWYNEPINIPSTSLTLERIREDYVDKITLPNGKIIKVENDPGPITNYHWIPSLNSDINSDENYVFVRVSHSGIHRYHTNQKTAEGTINQTKSIFVRRSCMFHDGTIVVQKEFCNEEQQFILLNARNFDSSNVVPIHNLYNNYFSEICALPSTKQDVEYFTNFCNNLNNDNNSIKYHSVFDILPLILSISDYLLVDF